MTVSRRWITRRSSWIFRLHGEPDPSDSDPTSLPHLPVETTMKGSTPLGPGREFDRIRGVLRGASGAGEGVQVPPGDDATVLDPDLVISTDLAVEGIHFRLDWLDPHEAGARAVGAAVSDLAAMGARLVGVLASVALPEGDLWAPRGAAFMAGIRDRVEALGGQLLGGDLTRSPSHLLVDVVAVGRTGRPLLRSGARPGDELWVTGHLGGAATAVRLWGAGRSVPASLRLRYIRPEPRLAEAIWLVEEAGARAGLDLSDGLAGDASHLAAASGVGVVLEASTLPLEPHPEVTLEEALHGGDDFEILVALPPGAAVDGRAEAFHRRFELPLTRVGVVRKGSGVSLLEPGHHSPVPLTRGGWDHFR
ncbi:MAG: thiamine-phosphate kinase [Gemmatimonadales bacterium]|nr:MAG: thiamine-phosphate kinase [Gemmatimonadales bacterium]